MEVQIKKLIKSVEKLKIELETADIIGVAEYMDEVLDILNLASEELEEYSFGEN